MAPELAPPGGGDLRLNDGSTTATQWHWHTPQLFCTGLHTFFSQAWGIRPSRRRAMSDCALVGRLARFEKGNARSWVAFRLWREHFALFVPRRRVSTHRRVAFRNGHLTNIIGESKGCLTIRDDACSYGATAKRTQNARTTA